MVNDSIRPSELAPRAEQGDSLYSAEDMGNFHGSFKAADEKSTHLPEIQFSDSSKIKELREPFNPKGLSEYGEEFASLLKPGMEPEQVFETFKKYIKEHGKELQTAAHGLHTAPSLALQYDFNKALLGTGYYVKAEYFTNNNEVHLMKEGHPKATDLGKVVIGPVRPGVLRRY